MKKRAISTLLTVFLAAGAVAGCGSSQAAQAPQEEKTEEAQAEESTEEAEAEESEAAEETEAAAEQTQETAANVSEETGYPGGKWEPGEAQYGVAEEENFWITTDDDIKLFASAFYPADLTTGEKVDEKFPVFIEFTPYGYEDQDIVPNNFLVEHGYIYLIVRCRGTGTSEGEIDYFGPRDFQDGVCIVDWASKEMPGSDGDIVLGGLSYPGQEALGTASLLGKDSPVKAVIAASIGLNNVYREAFMIAGMPTSFMQTYTSYGAAMWGNSEAANTFVPWYVENTLSGGDWAYDRENTWGTHGQIESAVDIANTDIPVLLWCGWQDIVEVGAFRAYTTLQNTFAGKSPEEALGPMDPGQKVSPKYQMIVGDWTHGNDTNSSVFLEWMETWVKGVDTGLQNTDKPLHMYEVRGDRWINTDVYPMVNEYTTLSLTAEGQMTDGEAAEETAQLVWGEMEQEGTVLTFNAAPVKETVTLAGPSSLTLYASSSNTSMVVIARLYDVAPDGSDSLITKGAVVGSLHELHEDKSWYDSNGTPSWPWPKLDEDKYLTPDEVTRFDIPLNPRLWSLEEGHALRLVLQTRSEGDRDSGIEVPARTSARTDPYGLTAPQQETVPGGVYTIHFGAEGTKLNVPLIAPETYTAVKSGLVPEQYTDSTNTRLNVEPDRSLPLDWAN